ncbi:hypothetical protein GMOD_00003826 [Pyrenophora seminiperda CCB06]|uniref:Uncharacterized protein n=1 Tax=Pyrenophora seminiperda CCB06 TaxID=1302712 RepID=A0A3M7M031_9PLEO|nr:hypothetical protein GMOD_00003826 [Pyrenophora seminiperda CCB06]
MSKRIEYSLRILHYSLYANHVSPLS